MKDLPHSLPLEFSKMEETNTKPIIDYTAVPAGWLIKGDLWTGQSTVSTVTCPECGRIGVISSQLNGEQTIVHSGRVVASGTLLGIDYCKIAVNKRMNNRENPAPELQSEMRPFKINEGGGEEQK
jgi:hypothetical protein